MWLNLFNRFASIIYHIHPFPLISTIYQSWNHVTNSLLKDRRRDSIPIEDFVLATGEVTSARNRECPRHRKQLTKSSPYVVRGIPDMKNFTSASCPLHARSRVSSNSGKRVSQCHYLAKWTARQSADQTSRIASKSTRFTRPICRIRNWPEKYRTQSKLPSEQGWLDVLEKNCNFSSNEGVRASTSST
jgi:hypothetical protein